MCRLLMIRDILLVNGKVLTQSLWSQYSCNVRRTDGKGRKTGLNIDMVKSYRMEV